MRNEVNIGENNRTLIYNNPSHAKLGTDNNDLPFILSISGHSASGKNTFQDDLVRRMYGLGSPVQRVINYKGRDSRGLEVPNYDFVPINSPEEFDKKLREGEIAVGYLHEGVQYGLSGKIFSVLDESGIPVIITDTHGLVALTSYMQEHNIKNRLISFMLHTTMSDAENRLRARASQARRIEEIPEINSRIVGLPNEFDFYRAHEDLFRHVFRNYTVEDISKYESMEHLSRRAIDLTQLERQLDSERVEDFRPAYANIVIQKLFGDKTSISDLLGSVNQGIQLSIPDDRIKMYSHEQGVPLSVIKKAATREIVEASNAYGIVTIYFGPNPNETYKKYLIDMMGEVVGLEHQHKETKSSFTRESKLSLKQMLDSNFSDFYISFSSYDPMRTPTLESRVHTIVFESLLYNRKPHVAHVPPEMAEKFIEGNGLKRST